MQTVDPSHMFSRAVPAQRWGVIVLLLFALPAVGTSAWEVRMRAVGLEAGDLDDSTAHWAAQWRKVNSNARDQVLLVGDSRGAADNNLDVWQQVSGFRPIQLSIGGASQTPILEHIAQHTDFKGLVVLGSAENRFYSDPDDPITQLSEGIARTYLQYAATQSPSQRVGHQMVLWLSRQLAFLDEQYGMYAILARLELSDRPGVNKFWLAIFPKIQLCRDDRNCEMWSGSISDEAYMAATRQLWAVLFPPARVPDPLIDAGIARQRRAIEQIRQRGGEVVLIRYPSAGDVLAHEQSAMPRAAAWDRLLSDTGTTGIYFEDYPEMRGLDVREWSHLTGADAKKFTRAYVSALCERLAWLKQHGATCPGYDDES